MRFAVFLTLFIAGVCSIPEQGKWQFNYNNKPDGKIFGVYKSMYKGSKVAVKVKCGSSKEVELSFRWVLRYSPCSEEYIGIDTEKESLRAYLFEPGKQWIREFKYREFEFIRNSFLGVKCSNVVSLPAVNSLVNSSSLATVLTILNGLHPASHYTDAIFTHTLEEIVQFNHSFYSSKSHRK